MTATLHDLLKSYREGGAFPSYDQLAAIAGQDQGGAAVRGEAVAEFNINDMMMVTLTPEGAAVWNQRYANLPLPAYLIPEKVDAGYVLKDQLWDLMEVFGPHTGLGRPAMFVGMRMAHTKPVAAIVSPRAADAPSEPSELPTTIRDGMHWPEGYVTDPNGKIIPPKGRYNDFKFGCDVGYGEGLASIKDTVANIGAQAVAKSRAADALNSQPTDAAMALLREVADMRDIAETFASGAQVSDEFDALRDRIVAFLASSQPTDGAPESHDSIFGKVICILSDEASEWSNEDQPIFDRCIERILDLKRQPTDGGVRNG